MTSGGAEVRNLDENVRALRKHAEDLQDLPAAPDQIAQAAATVARSTITRRTGRSASSIRPKVTPNRALVLAGGSGAPGVRPLNYGRQFPNGSLTEGTRFLNRAGDATEAVALRLIETDIDRLAVKKGLTS